MKNIISAIIFVLILWESQSAPAPDFVVSTEPTTDSAKETSTEISNRRILKIYEMHVIANVTNRFVHTQFTSRVKNRGDEAREASFSVVLPDTAYISGFTLEIDGKKYEAYVKEKEEAKHIYDQAVSSGLSAAHVSANARDSNRFDVSVNVEPQKKAAFYLNYEELLQRQNEQYEIVINIHPGQPVRDLQVDVNIRESAPLRFVKTPALRSGNEIKEKSTEDLDPRATVKNINSTSAEVKFSPNVEDQKRFAQSLGTDKKDGLAGQFVVQYDVERKPNGGEILLQDGYFVHFFAPSDVAPLPKQVVFVLDTSGSMYDRKIQQLKQAMNSILSELKENDLFNIVEFNSNVRVWDLNSNSSVSFPDAGDNWYIGESARDINELELPAALTVTDDNVRKARDIVNSFDPNGGTNIMAALKIALRLVELSAAKNKESSRQPLIVFLTDGDPTVDVTDTDEITKKITEMNSGHRKASIFSLSFGDGADKTFLQKLSLRNDGFSRHIYEAADASLQLEDFYHQISSPLLSNVQFTYTPSVSNLTKTVFPILFGGSELIVAGRTDEAFGDVPKVSAWGINGPINLHPVVSRPITHLERLWAYLTVKQILEAREIASKKAPYEKMALDLALKYSFVTPVSSLVVVKPNTTNTPIDAVAADVAEERGHGLRLHSFAASSASHGLTPFGKTAAHFNSFPLQGPPSYYPSTGVPYSSFSSGYSPLLGGSGYVSHDRGSIQPQAYDLDGVVDFVEEYETTPVDLTSVTTTLATNIVDTLKTSLPWLTKYILGDTDTISIPKGTYRLGLNETLTNEPECSNSPNGGSGTCKLLHECPGVHSLLINVTIYDQYFCEVNKFAGVCCPQVP